MTLDDHTCTCTRTVNNTSLLLHSGSVGNPIIHYRQSTISQLVVLVGQEYSCCDIIPTSSDDVRPFNPEPTSEIILTIKKAEEETENVLRLNESLRKSEKSG